MTAVIIILASIDVFTTAAVFAIVRNQTSERADWADERRKLIDRVIARHTGEIIALDRAEKHTPKPPEPERLIEGLS